MSRSGPEQSPDSSDVADPGMYDTGPQTFDPAPDASFLPHMIDVARKAGFRLHFHRIKRRPGPDGRRPDGRLIETYMAGLRTFVEGRGCAFTDETGDPSLTLDMYADGDHISRESRAAYMENFWRRVQPVLDSPQAKP